jgi:hypothetical protein
MSDLEFDIIDELYFVEAYTTLKDRLALADAELKTGLAHLIQKGWVKCLDGQSKEPIIDNDLEFDIYYQNYCYLATKKGLMAHNSR